MRWGNLLAWYRRGARDLPWRRNTKPYPVWISEIMLQQTQIDTAIPYYTSWMKRFPTLRALSRASIDDVLKAWEGLGYYARARNLWKAARSMKRLPRTAEAWREVPGVGPYTAAAIASIAFGERAAVFDGNVRRVLSRLAARDVTEPPLPSGDPGTWNQAVMELGQRICTPRKPKCKECPIAVDCKGKRSGRPTRWPTRKPVKAVPHRKVAVGLIWKNDRVFVQRRAEAGLLGGLWEFPGGKRKRGETYEGCLRREVREETGFKVDVGPFLVTVKHRYSHFSVELHAYHCFFRRGKGGRWVTPGGLNRLAMPRANRKILEALGQSGRPLRLVMV